MPSLTDDGSPPPADFAPQAVEVTDYTAILSGQTWWGGNSAARPVFLTYSFDTAIPAYVDRSDYTDAFLASFQTFSESGKTAARSALNLWAGISGVTFLEVPAGQGELSFTSFNFSLDPQQQGFAGFAYYPNVVLDDDFGYESPLGGDIYIDDDYVTNIGIIAHEIGHALGFKHPFDDDPTLPSNLDNKTQTVMSYTGVYPGHLGVFDVQAVQAIYGLAAADGTQVSFWSWDGSTLTQNGGAGADMIRGVSSADVIAGLDGADIIAGLGGNDKLNGAAGDDIIFGGDGVDILIGGSGNDYLNGGTGFSGELILGDTVDYSTAFDPIAVDLLNGVGGLLNGVVISAVGADIGSDAIRNAPTIIGGAGADTIRGGNEINTLLGGPGNDTLDGRGGNDYLDGGTGADTMSGGAGDDYYLVDSLQDIIIELSGNGDDTIATSLTSLTLANFPNVEHILYIGDAPQVVLGDDGPNTLIGAGGNDYLYAYGGDDVAAGNAGVDVFVLGSGNDTAYGGAGQDYIYGGDGDDTLIGEDGVDVLIAGAGADLMNGGEGGDYFYGEDGDDIGNGGAGNDIFVMAAGYDIANGDDGQDYFYMGDGDDEMNGGAGVDVMLGEAGNDTFNGGLGVDYMFLGPGGAGDNDVVLVGRTNSGVAVINNFEAGGSNDVIRLTGTGWTSFGQVQAALTDYTAAGGFCVLTLDADTNIWLIGVAPSQLTVADFVFA